MFCLRTCKETLFLHSTLAFRAAAGQCCGVGCLQLSSYHTYVLVVQAAFRVGHWHTDSALLNANQVVAGACKGAGCRLHAAGVSLSHSRSRSFCFWPMPALGSALAFILPWIALPFPLFRGNALLLLQTWSQFGCCINTSPVSSSVVCTWQASIAVQIAVVITGWGCGIHTVSSQCSSHCSCEHGTTALLRCLQDAVQY